VSNGA